MKTHTLIAVLILIGAMVGSFGEDVTPKPTEQNPVPEGHAWGGLVLDGSILKLRSERDIIWYQFHGNGTVSATLGEKDKYMSAPLLWWKISGKWLQILDDEGKLLFQMRPLKVNAKEISVDNGRGETEVFDILSDDRSKNQK